MSIAILNEVYGEVRRLAIAGSAVAPGDFRLQKLIPPLRKAGEKAPVFSRVAECADKVVSSTEKTAGPALLELASLVTSILYTQGTTGIEGKPETLPPSPIPTTRKQVSARILKPLLEAFASTGSGRLEKIKAAHEMNLFHDLRLVRPALQAIDDPASEISAFICEQVLPLYGQAILPELLSKLDLKGKSAQGRRLQLMHRLDPSIAREHVLKALEEGSKEVKQAAIECLGNSADDLNYLLEQSRPRNKEVRAAAALALTRMLHKEAQSRLMEILDSKDIDLLVRAALQSSPDYLLNAAIERAQTSLDELPAAKNAKDQQPWVERLLCLLHIACARMTAGGEALLIQLLDRSCELNKIKSTPGGSDVIEVAVAKLAGGSERGVRYLVDHREQLPASTWGSMLLAAREQFKPREFFTIFSPYLLMPARKKGEEAARTEVLVNHLCRDNIAWYAPIDGELPDKSPPLDDAWLALVLEHDMLPMVCNLSRLQHPKLHAYLTAKWEAEKNNSTRSNNQLDIVRAMLHSRHPAVETTLLEVLESLKIKTQWGDYFHWIRLARLLTPSALPTLEALVADPKTSSGFAKELLDAIEHIRTK